MVVVFALMKWSIIERSVGLITNIIFGVEFALSGFGWSNLITREGICNYMEWLILNPKE